MQIEPGKPGLTSARFDYSALGSFYVHCTVHGTNGFTSHPKDAPWLRFLLKDTFIWILGSVGFFVFRIGIQIILGLAELFFVQD